MGDSRDIRSFFTAAPDAKRRRTTRSSAAMEDRSHESTCELASATEASTDEAAVVSHGTSQGAESSLPGGQPPPDTAAITTPLERPEVFLYKDMKQNLCFLLHPSWLDVLATEFSKSYFNRLSSFLTAEESRKKTIYPPPEDVFAAFRDCPFTSLKVVILGQDPYHGPQQAHGLSFSVRPGVPPPPSLKNIFKEAVNDVGIARPKQGCLSAWCNQGVLLLNAVLTVRRSEPFSHKKQGWEQFTDAVIRLINANASNVVFLLWGKPAQEKSAMINSKKHLIVKSSHPSPLGATKTKAPFIGSRCFSQANAYLEKNGKAPIDWNIEGTNSSAT